MKHQCASVSHVFSFFLIVNAAVKLPPPNHNPSAQGALNIRVRQPECGKQKALKGDCEHVVDLKLERFALCRLGVQCFIWTVGSTNKLMSRLKKLFINGPEWDDC